MFNDKSFVIVIKNDRKQSKMKTIRLDKKFVLAIVTLILISTAIGALLVQQYFPQIGSIKAEGMEDPLEAWSEASYIIWQYNTTFYASRNMSTLDTELGSNATWIIQQVLNNSTGPPIQTIVFKGNFTLTVAPLMVYNYTRLDLTQATFTLAAGVSADMFETCNPCTEITFEGGTLNGHT